MGHACDARWAQGYEERFAGSLLVGIASGRKLAAIAVALIGMSVMGAMGMRRMLGEDESPMRDEGDAMASVSSDVPGCRRRPPAACDRRGLRLRRALPRPERRNGCIVSWRRNGAAV